MSVPQYRERVLMEPVGSSDNSSRRPPQTASEILSTLVEATLLSGGYLNDRDLHDAMSSHVSEPQRLKELQNISTLNKVVNNAISCYWYGHSVRVFKELEMFVIGRVATYRHMDLIPKRFEEFGLGCFLQNILVKRQFQFPDNIEVASLLDVGTADIICALFEFRSATRVQFGDQALEAKFHAFLRARFGRPPIGVDLDFKAIFANVCKSDLDWQGRLAAAKRECSDTYKHILSQAVRTLQNNYGPLKSYDQSAEQSPSQKRTIPTGGNAVTVQERIAEPFLRSIGIDISDLRRKFHAMKEHNSQWSPDVYFFDVMDSVWTNNNMRNPCLGLRVMAALQADEWVTSITSSEVQACYKSTAVSISEVLLVSNIPKGGRHLIASCVLGLMVYLLSGKQRTAHPGGSTTSAVDLTDEVDLTLEDDNDEDPVQSAGLTHDAAVCEVRQYLNAHLVTDIPQVCMDLVARLLQRLVGDGGFFEVDIDLMKTTSGKGRLNWIHIKRRMEAILDGHVPVVPPAQFERQKQQQQYGEKGAGSASQRAVHVVLSAGRCALAKDDYVAIVTICVIYHRLLHAAETNPALLATTVSPSPRSAAAAAAAAAGVDSADRVSPRVAAIQVIVDSLRLLMADEQKLSVYVKLSQASSPACAVVCVFSTLEKTVNEHFRVPAFECIRLGGSFLQYMDSQLHSDRTGDENAMAGNILRSAVSALVDKLTPPPVVVDAVLDSCAAEDVLDHTETTSSELEAPSNEALMAAVSTHLSAVLNSREFAQDSGTDGVISSAAAHSVTSQVTQLLSEVEQRVQETEGFWTSASANSSASFLNIATALIEGNAEVVQRVQHLLALPQVSDVEKTHVGSEEEAQGSLQMHRSVSVELAMQAVLLNVSSGHCLSIFDSLQQCKDSIAQVLMEAFHIPLRTGLRQADRVFQHLKGQGWIHFDENRGSVEIRTSLASSTGSILTFASAADATICEGDQDDKLRSSTWTENMIKLLLQTPLGTSCAEFTLWVEQQFSVDIPSIAEFILQHQAVLQSRRPAAEGVTFFVIPGTDDCVPLPQGIPSVEVSGRLIQALQTKQYSLAASYCMAASMTLIDETAVGNAVNAFFLQSYESLGADAMDRLSDLSLQLASALPRTCRAGQCAVLRLCLKALAAAGKINNDTAQHCVWQAAVRSGAAGLHLVRLLVSVGMAASVEFPVFAQCTKEWSTNGVNIISRAVATSTVPVSAESLQFHYMPAARSTASASCDDCDMDVAETGSDAGTVCSFESAVVELADSSNAQKAFVLRLLQEKYHYMQGGLVRPAAESPEGRQLQQAMMLLSATLYSSQVHFVMELIQNADDNTYLPGVTPTIRLELFPHAVVVYINEQGFTEKDVEAICNVGGSTKVNKTGYIGQKGIGFKSVFSISDVPEVHSNGYHIAFRREVSMLEPQWLDPTTESQWPSQYDSSGTYYETCLRLRLDTAALKNFAKLNQDIQAVFNGKLILFLNKLERMVLEDRMRNQVVEHCRTRLGDNWMRISIEASTSASTSSSPLSASTLSEVFWLVLRHRFSPTVRRMEVVVAETEVAIAFKFIKTGRRFEPPKQPHNPETEDEHIRLDFSEGLMPVYAYLPTSTCCFRFMVQGDFVLPTNRESILEQNEWNLGLLNQVPRVFVQAITEMSRWCEAESQALVRGKPSNNGSPSIADFPVLSQLAGSDYRLLIEPADLLRALPRRREATRDYIEGVVSNIYKELRAVPCLQSRSGAMCAPSQLVAVHHLDFDPVTFVSEDLLLAATGCQYAMHDIGAYELDNDLAADLGVRIFDTSCIVECLQHLSEITCHAQRVAKIAHALLGLETLSRLNAVHKQSRGKSRIAVGSGLAHTLEPAVRDLLRQLCIWPTSTGTFVTLEHTLLLVQKRRGGVAFTSQQQECLNEFKDHLHMIDASLLDAAAACTTQGADLLINFLVDNFKQVRLSGGGAGFGSHSKTGPGTELGAQFSGGVEELTSDIVLKRVILPSYKRFAEQQNAAASAFNDAHSAFEAQETKETEPGLDRRTAAAFLAFVFHSHWGSRVNLYTNSDYSRFVQTIGVVVPTLTATETADGLAWDQPSLMLVKGGELAEAGSPAPQTEVHLGLEITESASSVLAALHTTTALRQLSWQVLDPLAACLMLGSSKVSLDQHKEAYTAAEVNAAFRAAQNLEDMKQWKEFLLRLGLVNFFGVYKTGLRMLEAPQLIRLLDVLFENAVPVRTNFKFCGEHQANADGELLPLFLPGFADETDHTKSSVLRVTQDVHNSLLKIAELIPLEVLQARQTKAASSVEQGSAFLADLDRRCWLPIEVHEKLRDGSFGSAHGHCVCAPRYVISTHAEKSSSVVWYFGAHCAYLPHKLASNPAFRSLFHFHEISSKDSPSAEFLMGYLIWLCKQTDVSIFSSVKFMRWFYDEVKTSLLNSKNAHASTFVQQQLTALLQNDAALVWIPDQVQLGPQASATAGTGTGVVDPYHNESFSICYAGKMFPLSRLVKRDPSEHLHFDASPVKSLALFYGGTAVMDLFARTQYCKTCQAVEGMFGVRGGGDYSLFFPQLRCTCVHATLLSVENGAVRDSPGAVDLAEVLQHHCDDAEQGSLDALQRADSILTTLSVNVWKCFRIETGLRPYSSHQLLSLRTHFSEYALLPLHFSNQFVSSGDGDTGSAVRIALDDLEAFKLFEPELVALQGSVEWLQVFSADSPEVDNVFEEDGGSSAYDLDALKESEQHLLQLPASEFRAAVGTIPKQTFLAPSNKLALYEFLGIKKFSDHIQESWIKEPSAKQTKTGPAATLVGILNNLLTYAQAHYHHREQKKQQTPQLSQFDALQVYNMVTQLGSAGTRVHSLMQMEVVECRVLQRRVTLALGEVRAENVLDATHHREFSTSPAGTRTNTLYVSAQLSAAEVQNLAVSLLTKALRVEVALLEQRHDEAALERLQRKLTLVASRAVNPEILQTILDANDLGPLPPEISPWEMKDGNRTTVSTVPVSLFALLNALSPEQKTANQPNLDAYERMQHSTTAHRINAAVQRRSLDASFPSSAPSLGSPAVQATQSCTADGDSSVRTPPSHPVVHPPAPPIVPPPPSPVFRPPLPPGPPPPPTTPILGLYSSRGEGRTSSGAIATPSPFEQEANDHSGEALARKKPLTRTGKKRAWDDTVPSPPSVSIGAADSGALSGTYVFNSSTTPAPCQSIKKQRAAHCNSLRASPQVDIVFCEPSEEAQCLVQVPVGEQLVAAVEASALDRPRSSSEIVPTDAVSKDISLNHTFVSGRLGEELAVRHLHRRLLQQSNVTPGSTPCTAVHWLNEHTESGLPYDIELTFADGSVKHCEVKTHSIANHSPPAGPHQQSPTQQSSVQQMQAPSQWLVSPAEVAQAHLERQGYFCVFVSLRIDYATHQVEELQTRIVGYEHGFVNAIRNKDAKLWVEVSDEHGAYS